MRRDDTVFELEAALGFGVITSRASGCRYGEKDYVPGWEVLEMHRHWYELVYVVAPDGFGIVVLAEQGTDTLLTDMLDYYLDTSK